MKKLSYPLGTGLDYIAVPAGAIIYYWAPGGFAFDTSIM